MKNKHFLRNAFILMFSLLVVSDVFSQGSSEKQIESTTASSSKNKTILLYSTPSSLSWDTNITFPDTTFSNADSGCTLYFDYTIQTAPYHNIKIYSGTWESFFKGEIKDATNNGGVFIPRDSNGTFSYSPSSEEIELLVTKGLIVHGYGIRLNKISMEISNPSSSQAISNTTPLEKHGQLHVNGAYLYDSSNHKVQLYGMSTHGLNFGQDFTKYVKKETFKTLRDEWNTNCIRLVLYPRDYNGYLNGGNKYTLKKIICDGIDIATELGMYVIVDWHVHNYNPTETQAEAVSFLSEISSLYPDSPNVLYEICNEPTNSDWNSVLKPYAEKVIPEIRKNSPNCIIIVGTNTWSQDIEGPLANPLTAKNIMYTFHFYAHTHKEVFRNRVENCIKAGLPIFITEFGTCDASGNGKVNTDQSAQWFDLLKKYGISHMNWSLSNKAEAASAIKSSCSKTSAWSTNDLTESGKLVYNHFRSLEN